MIRDAISDAVEALLEFGKILASKMGASQSTLVTARVAEDADGHEEIEDCEVWGEPAILWRPAAPDSSGSCEALTWRRGDELVIVAGKERRWQISLEEGEVVLRAFGPGAATVRLTASGGAVIDATEIKLGSTAAQHIALGDALQTYLASLKTWLDTHTHGGVLAGGAVTLIPAPLSPAVPTVKSASHLVES